MKIVNWALLKHPLNWLTVILMLFFAAIAGTLILEGLGIRPATADDSDGDNSITGAGPTTAGAMLTGGDFFHATVSQNPAPGLSLQDTVTIYG
jgi:hypothetical protein